MLAEHTATYSPEDDKLRMYPAFRLDRDDYEKAKALGFRWAPKQELFFATWSPQRLEWLENQCPDGIEDENSSLAERAQERSERFETYSENRQKDGDSAYASVKAIADRIPLGQPILVGHHSERGARADQKRIHNGMDKACKMWETSKYWESRAARALSHASYVSQPAVRARRIKKLEAERRKWIADSTPIEEKRDIVRSMQRTWNADDKDKPIPHVLIGQGRAKHWTPEASIPALQAHAAPWIAHLDLRITYEKAMLGEQGAAHLLEKPKRKAQPPILNYRAPDGIRVHQKWGSDCYEHDQIEMTKAEYKALHSKWMVLSEDKSHRVRFCAQGGFGKDRTENVVFLTDSKEHEGPRCQRLEE